MKKKRKGFTLTELIAVIVILALIVLIAIPAYNTIRKKALQKQYDNLVMLIETTAEKFAAANGTNLTNVQELIDNGLLETDDGSKILDPRDNSKMNCFLIEITYKKGSYDGKLTNKKQCDLAQAKRDYGTVNIIIKGLVTGKEDYAFNEWINEDVELRIDRTNMSADEVIESYRWLSGSGQSSNLATMSTNVTSILNAMVTVEVTTTSDRKYWASTNLKIDKEAPVINDVEVSGGNDWTKGRVVKINATDQSGSGISGYYLGTTPCNESSTYVANGTITIESNDILDETDYYVCVKDNVGNRTAYDKVLSLSIKDKVDPICKWSGESTNWTNDKRVIELECEDNESGCDTDHSGATYEYNTTTKTATIEQKIKDIAGNETLCKKEVNVYVDKIAPTCGAVTNASTTWTKNNRTIKQACTDNGGSGCEKASYDTTYSSGTTKTASITIKDKAGNKTSCAYNVYVDKTAPSCETATNASTTWTKNNRTIKQACTDNGGSGCVKTSYDTTYSSGTTKTSSVTISDNVGNTRSCTYNVYVDKTAPTAPTTMEFVYGDWSRYDQGSWADSNVFAGYTSSRPSPSGSTDTGGSGVAKYQISTDNSTWYDYNYDYTSNRYCMSSEGIHTRYFRAVDSVGNASSSISRTAKIDKCTNPSSYTSSWSACAACGTSTQTRTTTYTGVSGKSCGSKKESKNCFIKACTPTVTISGNINGWVCGSCRDNCSDARVISGGTCLKAQNGQYGNTMGKVTYVKSDNRVTFNWEIRQGNQTHIGNGYWVKFIIKNSSSTIYTGYLKKEYDAKWSPGTTHTGSVTYTFNSKGTYYIYIEGNSGSPNFDMDFGTIKVS